MAGSTGGKVSKGGSTGQASNAALQDDEDIMARRRALFGKWKQKKIPNQMIGYVNSPTPPAIKRTK